MKPFFHPPLSPWKSLRRFPHSHRHDDYEDDYFSSKPGRLRDTHSEGKIKKLDLQPGVLKFVRLCIELLFITGNRAADSCKQRLRKLRFQLFEKVGGERRIVVRRGHGSRLGSLTHDVYFITEQRRACKHFVQCLCGDS